MKKRPNRARSKETSEGKKPYCPLAASLAKAIGEDGLELFPYKG
jgi:hypothetical protein